jgi:uncharacterized protein
VRPKRSAWRRNREEIVRERPDSPALRAPIRHAKICGTSGRGERVTRPFLAGEWRWLALLNYEMDASVLRPLVPRGTELDSWSGRPYASLVGFLFRSTRVIGIPIPFHRSFEEVNLRFYVRRKKDGGWRRGVVFVRELIPRQAVAWMARSLYNEKYWRVPMSHWIDAPRGNVQAAGYSWTLRRNPYLLEVQTAGDRAPIVEGTEQDFFAGHHWGYTTARDGGTFEYRVDHPRWSFWSARAVRFEGDAQRLYGDAFADALSSPPASAFLADGSPIAVHWRARLEL